jgi:hemolysin activation/secretion protein
MKKLFLSIRPFSCLLICLGIGQTSAAHAQSVAVPTTVDPSRFQNQIPKNIEQKSPNNIHIPASPSPLQEKPPEGAEKYTFTLKQINIDGVTAYNKDAFADITTPYIGKKISVADLYFIAGRITERYQKDGYVLSNAIIPMQEIENGVVKINMIEGYIADVTISGDKSSSYPILGIIEDIKQTRPLNIKNLERKLILLQELPGKNARGVLEPLGKQEALNAPGGVRLNVLFADEPAQTVVSVDNYGSKFVGPWQGGIRTAIPHNFLFTGLSNWALYTTPDTSELTYLSWAESAPISSDGLTLNSKVSYSKSKPGSTLRSLDLFSTYKSFSIGLEYPVFLSRQNKLSVYGNFEVNNIGSDILSTRFYDDRLRVMRVGGKYSKTHNEGSITESQFEISQGLDVLGSRETGSTDLSRTEGHSDFTKILASYSHSRSVSDNLAVSTTVSGQYAFSPLLSSEEFGYGGSQIGRAYDNSEITGDSGVGLSLEFVYQGLTDYVAKTPLTAIQPFIFYDIGKVWNRDQDVAPQSGSSAGGGVRLALGSANLTLTVAQPLTRAIANPKQGDGKDPRFLISTQYKF